MIKKFLFSTAIIIALLGIAIAEPNLSMHQVMKLRDVILKEENEKYRNVFGGEPAYDEKMGSWTFVGISVVDAPFYHLEIREKDGYYRLGWVSKRGSSGATSERFRMSPNIKRKVEQLLEEFKQAKKKSANKSPLPTGFSSTVSPQPPRFRPAAGLGVLPRE